MIEQRTFVSSVYVLRFKSAVVLRHSVAAEIEAVVDEFTT
jgi:hypothetical protein